MNPGLCTLHVLGQATHSYAGGRLSLRLTHPGVRRSCGRSSEPRAMAPKTLRVDQRVPCGVSDARRGKTEVSRCPADPSFRVAVPPQAEVLRCLTGITMMEASDHGRLDYPALSRCSTSLGSGRVLLQREVCSGPMVVVRYRLSRRRRWVSFSTTTWSRHSRRSVPMRRSTYGFCQGDRGAVLTSWIPMDCDAARERDPVDCIVIAKEVSRGRLPGERLHESAGPSTGRWARR